jgi:hypothetical protein
MLPLALLLAALVPPPQDDPFRIPLEGEGDSAAGFDQAALDAKLAEILPRLERIRGWDFRAPVSAGVQSIEGFRAFAASALEEEYGAERFAGMMTTAHLLGWLPEDRNYEEMMKEMLEAAVGGYYDAKTSKFWIMDGFSRGPLADMIMAHELEHALDDQHYPLDPLFLTARGNSDREFAARCVVEGSATSAMNLYLVQAIQQEWLPPGELLSGDMIGEQLRALEKVPLAVVAGLILPYIEGSIFLLGGGTVFETAMKRPADADLRRAFSEPPLSSEQILHPEKYWEAESADPPRAVEVPDRSAALGPGWQAVDHDTLGEIGCAFLIAQRLPTALELQFGAAGLRLPASSGWGGDRYRTYRHAAGGRLLHAITEWDSEADAAEFEAACALPVVRGRAPYLREVVRAGVRVELLFADAAGAAALARVRPE